MASLSSIARRTGTLLLLLIVLGVLFALLNIDAMVLSAFDFTAEIATSVLPEYQQSKRVEIAVKILQVAVLYFAVLVTAVQFMNEDQQFAYESDRLLYLFLPLSIILVSASALLAILSILGLKPKVSLFGSLMLMGTAFLSRLLRQLSLELAKSASKAILRARNQTTSGPTQEVQTIRQRRLTNLSIPPTTPLRPRV